MERDIPSLRDPCMFVLFYKSLNVQRTLSLKAFQVLLYKQFGKVFLNMKSITQNKTQNLFLVIFIVL